MFGQDGAGDDRQYLSLLDLLANVGRHALGDTSKAWHHVCRPVFVEADFTRKLHPRLDSGGTGRLDANAGLRNLLRSQFNLAFFLGELDLDGLLGAS